MKNILLIVDPQNDFITGTLPVEGAAEKMRQLADYILENSSSYDHIYITMDTHPTNHMSFIKNGGLWPDHCIYNEQGWELYPHIEYALKGCENVDFYLKGNDPTREGYSIFDGERDGDILSYRLRTMLENDDEVYIDVCGIAGDYCVLETLKGLKEIVPTDNIYVIEDFTASIDGGAALNDFMNANGITYLTDLSINLTEYGNN